METIRIYNENCVAKGKECFCMKDAAEHCGDCTEYEISQETVDRLNRMADSAGAGPDLYYRKCARTVAEYL